MAQITSDIISVGNLLDSDFIYTVPDFQRGFVWTSEQIKDMMSDFEEDSDVFSHPSDEYEGYLLGNFVVIEKDKTRFLIDGQQRLTSLTLLYKALYKRNRELTIQYGETNYYDDLAALGRDLKAGFLKRNQRRLTHDESLSFGTVYKDIINDNEVVLDENDPDNISDQNIIEVFEEITEQVSKLTVEQHINFCDYLSKKVFVILTAAPNEAKAFQLFEILNNRGVKLGQIDLIKNFLLKRLKEENVSDEDFEEFKNNWKEFIDNLVLNKRSAIPENQFLKHYVIGKFGKKLKVEELYGFIKDTFNDKTDSDILALSDSLKKSAETYKNIHYKRPNSFMDDENKLRFLVDHIGIKQLYFLLIPFYEAPKEVRDEILNLTIRLGASVLFSYTQTNFIEKEIPLLINKHLVPNYSTQNYKEFKKEIEKIIDEKAEEAYQVIKIRKFETGSSKRPVKKAQSILRFIEYYSMNNELAVKNKHKKQSITVEHILPQRLDEAYYETHGFKDKEEYLSMMNMIGNLTLLLQIPNTSASNKAPEEKKVHFKSSEFYLSKKLVSDLHSGVKSGSVKANEDFINESTTSYLTVKNGFNKESILKRSDELAAMVKNLLLKKN